MKITHNKNKLNLDTNKRIYTCTNCGELFNWGDNCFWFGSYKMLENNPSKIIYACSEECRVKLGK